MPHDLSGENVWWASAEPHYEDFYTLWDTFRTLHPLLTLIEPDRQRAMVRSLIDTYAHTGWLPDGRVAGANGLTQGGSNADVVLADAIVKDLGGFDARAALGAMRKDGEIQSPDPDERGARARRLSGARLYAARPDPLGLAHARICLSTISRSPPRRAKLGEGDARRPLRRALAAAGANLWDPESLCIRPRYADGHWLENFDCDREYPDQSMAWWDAPYYEGTARQYSTYVPHDVEGLIARTGGRAALRRLARPVVRRRRL